MKEVKTDNFMTKVVVKGVEELYQRRKTAREKYKVPFMMRERTKRERRRQG